MISPTTTLPHRLQLMCGVCLEPRRRRYGGLHPECCKLLGDELTALVTPIWPISRHSKERAILETHIQQLFQCILPPELAVHIFEIGCPWSTVDIRYATERRLRFDQHRAPEASHTFLTTQNGLSYIRHLESREHVGQRCLVYNSAAPSQCPERPESTFVILTYDDANCTDVRLSNHMEAPMDTSRGEWYRVQPSRTLTRASDVTLKAGVAFFNISPSAAVAAEQEPDCVWSTPCRPPPCWYRCPPPQKPTLDPLEKSPVQMRVLGDPSNAYAITFASLRSEGNCGILLHGEDKEREPAFYEQLEEGAVCQYVPLLASDFIDAVAILGAGEPDKLCSPCIVLYIGGPNSRTFVSGPYIPIEKRDSFRLVPLTPHSERYITSIAVNESLLGCPSNDLRLGIWYSDKDTGRLTAVPDNTPQWPASGPSDELRISSRTGSATWSTVHVSHSDTFLCYTRRFHEVEICIGLLFIKKDHSVEVLGQWRHPYEAQQDEPKRCDRFVLRRINIGKTHQVQLVGVESISGDDVLPLLGVLEWLTDGRSNDVVARSL